MKSSLHHQFLEHRFAHQPLFGEVLLGPLVQERGTAPRPLEMGSGRR
jgi:hypothetical protein